jgi:Flp pilus assembly protein protease CpaA
MDNSMAIRLSLLLLVLVAAVYDFRFRRIPKWLNAIAGEGLL